MAALNANVGWEMCSQRSRGVGRDRFGWAALPHSAGSSHPRRECLRDGRKSYLKQKVLPAGCPPPQPRLPSARREMPGICTTSRTERSQMCARSPRTRKALGQQSWGPARLRSGISAFRRPGKTRSFPSRGAGRALAPAAAGAPPAGGNSAPAAAALAGLPAARGARCRCSESGTVLSGFMGSLICLFFFGPGTLSSS